MKVGDLVAYAWNAKERPEEVELAIVVNMNPSGSEWIETEYIQIHLQAAPEFCLSPALCVPRFKLDVISAN